MITKETSRLSAPGYALRSNAAGKTRKTGKESTLKNTVSCIDNPGHYRLATIVHASQIIVIRHGVVAEQGTHSELLVKNGIYARLHNLQFGGDAVVQ